MTDLFKKLFYKAYYPTLRFLLTKTLLPIPDSLKETKNVFIYFDYEREFGGHKTIITDENIVRILDILQEFDIKTTWFTVGKIFEHYPESIKELINRGHEIGSHTYEHINPLLTNHSRLRSDFDKYYLVSNQITNIKGFHCPHSKWSLYTLRLLSQKGYQYDITGSGKRKEYIPHRLRIGKKKHFLRICILGDDWKLYGKKVEREEAFAYFEGLFYKLRLGEIGGIGIHPWVLFEEDNILHGFYDFVRFLSKQENVRVNSAIHFVEMLEEAL